MAQDKHYPRRAEKKAAKQAARQPGILSRRKFIVGGLAAGGLAALVTGTSTLLPEQHNYDFLNTPIERTQTVSLELLAQKCIPLDPEIPRKRDSPEVLAVREYITDEVITREIKKKDFDMRGKYEVTVFMQHYGVPGKSRTNSESLLKYVQAATEHLYSRIRGLDEHNFLWTIIKKGDDFSKNNNKRVYIGNNSYDKYRIFVENKNDKRQNFSLATARSIYGSLGNAHLESGNMQWFIFICEGQSAIQAPFSEIIPLTTIKQVRAYDKKVGRFQAMTAEETISEGISYHLALEMVQKLNIPNGKKFINDTLQVMQTQQTYRQVPQSIRWVNENGVQNAFDLYMADPAKFMSAIKNS